jgi:CubicO group peptidase (beta-lactamase class C family)
MSRIGFAPVEAVITAALDRVFPAAQIEIRQAGRVLLSRAYGWLDPETRQHPTRPDTLFDLASVTKLFVVTAFMTLVEQGKVGLDQPVCTVLPDFTGLRPIQPYEDPLKPGAFVTVNASAPGPVGDRPEQEWVDAGAVTFRHLLAHNSGLPAWRPLYRAGTQEQGEDLPPRPPSLPGKGEARSPLLAAEEPGVRSAAHRMALATHFSYPTGTRVVYSDIGLILLGMAVEALTGLRLDEAVRARVTEPLRVLGIRYSPVERGSSAASTDGDLRISNLQSPISNANIAPTELCAWRGRRIVGEVHDENAYSLGGIAGHAGLFANAHDLARFGQSYLDALQPNRPANQPTTRPANQPTTRPANQPTTRPANQPTTRPANQQSQIPNPQSPLRAAAIAEMTRLQSQDGATRRGLGFALWSPDPEASSNPLSERAFGHTGFTGTSLWIDPARDLVVACLTNRVYYGRDASGILAFRVALHRAVVEVL